MSRLRVLVVDDSAFMRKVIGDMISAEPDLELVGTARDGEDGLKRIVELNPDIVTLDVEMPVLDGLSALEKIMVVRPTPVVMLSSLTREGADATIIALERGAVDFVTKPSGPISLDIDKVREELLAKVRMAATARVGRVKKPVDFALPKPAQPIRRQLADQPNVLALIGTSTGGPKALNEVVPRLPADFKAAVLIVQHMPPGFTRSLADRLNACSRIPVKEAEDGEEILGGKAYIAPGDYHLTVNRNHVSFPRFRVRLTKDPLVNGHRPSVDTMMLSAAREFPGRVVATILTGMGRDGTEGMRAIKAENGFTIAEDQSTCVVYGMPRSVIEAACVDRVAPLYRVADEIVSAVSSPVWSKRD